ncbi:MAG: hypothetical protein BAJALOKI1v1_210016 [Promethearchaeota archaeon]|nr:MAG: hypothetical protein BAJALOKI1v1_210016 [Candidatus Lokiarchaeota archaeon]
MAVNEDVYNRTVREITRLILTNEKKMIREEDLINLCDESLDFEQIISEIYANLKKVGLDLIVSTFLEQRYYVLTSEGKDDTITPSQYGALAFILALSKEVDDNLNLEDAKQLFSNIWKDVEFLLKHDYLRKLTIKNLEILKVTPLGKALLKNVIPDLKLKHLLELFKK